MGTVFLFSRILLLKVGIFIFKISKMIPKTAIVIFATLLVAIEAKSSQDLIGERLKGFHDHFTSQANVIKDAGINTDKIMNSLSTQLKSLLQDAVKEMNDMEAKAIDLQHQLDAEKKTTASLKDANEKLTEKNKVLQDDKEKLDVENGKLKTDLAKCNTDSSTCKTDLTKCETDSAKCKTGLTKCKKDLEELGKVCHAGLLECKSNLEDIGEKLVQCNQDLTDCKNLKTCSECKEKLGKCDTQLKTSEKENNILQNERDKCLVDLEVCRGGVGWEKVNGRYVKHFNDQKVTWSQATASCEERNSKLLMVKDDVTQEWTKKIHTPVWIGA